MKQIHNWEDLAQLEPSATHYLEIDLKLGCGRLRSSDGQYESYLSTHTFYGYGVMRYISEKLQACGFDVELIGWDKEPKNKVELDCGYRSQIRLVNERSDDIHTLIGTLMQESVGLVREQILRVVRGRATFYFWSMYNLKFFKHRLLTIK